MCLRISRVAASPFARSIVHYRTKEKKETVRSLMAYITTLVQKVN